MHKYFIHPVLFTDLDISSTQETVISQIITGNLCEVLGLIPGTKRHFLPFSLAPLVVWFSSKTIHTHLREMDPVCALCFIYFLTSTALGAWIMLISITNSLCLLFPMHHNFFHYHLFFLPSNHSIFSLH